MAWVHGEIVISRPAGEVFDCVAGRGDGPGYRPRAARAGKTECTRYERPRLLATRTRTARADTCSVLRFDSVAGGTRMRWSERVRPKGAFRLLGPAVAWRGNRRERRTWAGLKARLESARWPAAAG
jgi:hypothetical protein